MFLSAGRLLNAGGNSGPVDPYYNSVYSLLHFDGANGDTSTIDVKGNTVNLGSGASLSSAQTKFGPTSLATTGVSTAKASLAIPAIGTQDFTIELWVRFNIIHSGGTADTIFDCRPTSTEGLYPTLYYHSAGGGWNYYTNSASRISGGTAAVDSWGHVALSRVNGVTRLFVNGTQVGSNYTDTNSYVASAINYGANSSAAFNLNGYIDEARITIGVGRYSANFTAPTAPFPTKYGDPFFNNVYALMHFDGANGATTTTDVKGHAVTVGTPGCQISTAQSKFGGSSMSFTKVTNAKVSLDIPAMGTQDFTIEFWTRFNTVAGAGGADSLFDARPLGQNGPYPDILYQGTGGWTYFVGGATVINGGSAVANTWYHVAVSRVSGTTRMFVNGAQVGSSHAGVTDYNVPTTVNMGATMNTGNGNLDGYMDDVRITVGTGRYASSFTPPPLAFPNS